MIQKTKDILQHYASKISIWLKNGAGKDKKTCNTRQKSRKFLPPENYIDTKDKLESLVKRLKSKNEISVDIEGDSLYSYYSKICLIQISTRNENFIVDPLSIKDVSMLSSVFSDEKIQKVLHGSHYDIHMLYTCSGIEMLAALAASIRSRPLLSSNTKIPTGLGSDCSHLTVRCCSFSHELFVPKWIG